MSAGDLGGPRFAAVAAAARSCQTRRPRLSATRVWTRGPPCDATRARPPRAVPSSAATRAVRDKRGSRDVLSNLERSIFGQRKTRRTTYGDLVRKVPRNRAASRGETQKLGTTTTIHHSWALAKKRRQSLPRHGGALERATREGRRGGVQAGEESRMGRPRRRRVPREPRRALRRALETRRVRGARASSRPDRGTRDEARPRPARLLQAHQRDCALRRDTPRGRYIRRTAGRAVARARRRGRRCGTTRTEALNCWHPSSLRVPKRLHSR